MSISTMNNYNNNCLGVVLTGGLSSRMGEDKAKLMRNCTNMLDFSKSLLLDIGLSNVVVSGGFQQTNNRQQVTDIVEKAGPVGGIYSVIKTHKPQAILVLPVDLPLMTSHALTKLKQVGELSGKACFYQDHNIPLYLPVNAFVELFLLRAFKSDSFKQSGRGPSIRTLLKQIPHQTIASEDNQTLFNTNTPEQWQQAQLIFKKQAFKKQSFEKQTKLGSL